LVGAFWYAFQMWAYLVLANLLVYVTFHEIDPSSPSYPGPVLANGTRRYRELYDSGFWVTPDLSYRPFFLKAIFVDMMVSIAQIVPPILLIWNGHTREYVCYVGLIGIQNILKGIVQIATVLPAARQGEHCWGLNFKPEELQFVRTQPVTTWLFTKPWGMTHGCNDMLWSGHTSQSCIGLLFIDKALRHAGVPRYVRGLLAAYFAVYVWAVLACRMHYSIDVMVATLIAVALYTHSPLRYSIWYQANKFVSNPPHPNEDYSAMRGSEDDEEESATDEDDEVEMGTLKDRDATTASGF